MPLPIIIGGIPGMPGGGIIMPLPMLGAIVLPEAPMPAAGPRSPAGRGGEGGGEGETGRWGRVCVCAAAAPAGALMVALGMVRPAARPAPGPAAAGATLRASSDEGGDST